MATFLHAESRRLYSWWWDSHISPKNSKWLQENLTDMDSKVKSMIKLIEEDADSFARRAEMYYKKRPELMKLVEEFYRAYRALAERYDHATGALRHAHRTMAEAFPNQIPLVLTDESPSGSYGTEVEPNTPEMPAPIRPLYDPDDLQKDALGISSNVHVIKRNGAFSEENDMLSRKGLKQLNEMFATGEGEARANFHEGRARKGLHFQEEEGKCSEYKTHDWPSDLPNQESSGKEDVPNEIRRLLEELSQLSTENQNLKSQIRSESEHADKAETEVQSLKEGLSKLNFEKEAAILQYQQSLERISYLETQISRTQDDFKKLNDDMVMGAMKLSGAEERCLLLQKANQSLQLQLDTLEQKTEAKQELSQLSTENQNLKIQITSESERAEKAEIEVQSLRDSLSKLNFEKEAAILQYQQSLERISYLETQISLTQDDFKKLNDEMVMEAMKLSGAEERCLLLEKSNQTLQLERDTLKQRTKAQQKELNHQQEELEKFNISIQCEHHRCAEAEMALLSMEKLHSQSQEELKLLALEIQSRVDKLKDVELRNIGLEEEIHHLKEENNNLCEENLSSDLKIKDLQDEINVLKETRGKLEDEIELYLEEKKVLRHELDYLKDQKTKAKQEFSQLSTENQNLKSQITSESERAEKAEIEVQSLKDSLSKLNFEKEATILQYQQYLARISYLETQISRTQDDFKKLNDEMVTEAMKLSGAEERCLLLEKSNQSLHLERDTLKQRTKSQLKELNHQQEELEKLNISIQCEHQPCVEAEMALLSMEKLHSQSQEELKLLSLEIQSKVDKLKDMGLRNIGIEEEIHHLKEENNSLCEEKLSSALKIKDLPDEINVLKETRGKLEDEIRLYLEEKKVLLHELDYLKEGKNDLEQRHRSLKAEMEAVSLNAESLQALVKELQDGHVELNEICKKHEEEKLLLLENMKNMENISEKNVVLENSLVDATVELEVLREKIKTLEDSCESLLDEISTHITEKAVLVSQVETIAQNMEKLMEKNVFSENSLSVMNLEPEGSRVKLKNLEKSFLSLYDQKENLLAEKNTLVSQVENISQRLENLESRHAELEDKHSSLEREKDLTLHQVMELEGFLKLEKQQHETLIRSSKSQLATLENQILVLREEIRVREEEFEMEQQKVLSALIEIFILHGCLRDLKETNLILSKDCQKHLEASRCADKLVSQLKQENLFQKEMIASLSEKNEKVREGSLLMLMALNINEERGSKDGVKDEVLLQIILGEIRNLLNSISCAQDEIQLLQLEMSVIVTLLKQIGLHVEDLRTEKHFLEQELEIRKEEVLVLQCKKQELLDKNEQLTQDVQVSGHREEELKAAMETLLWELADLQEAQQTSQTKIHKLLDENQFLSKKFYNLREEKDALEEENSVVLEKAMTLEHLYLLFRSFNAERALELKLFSDDTDCLLAGKKNLEQEIREMNEKMSVLDVENTHLKESVAYLEEFRNCLIILEFDLNASKYFSEELTHQLETGKNLLIQKEMELSEANQEVQSMQDKNRELGRSLEGLNQDIFGAKVMRDELENKIYSLSEGIAYRDKEITLICEANEMLYGKVEKLNSEVEVLRSREEHLTSKLQKGIDEVDQCEVEMMTLLNDVQISTVSAAIFEEKVYELILVCESLEICAMVQTEVLNEEITSRNACVSELKKKLNDLEEENRGLKASLNVYPPLVTSLRDTIASLEEKTLSLAGHHSSNKQEKQDNSLVSHQQHDKGSPLTEDPTAMVLAAVLELHKVIAKVEALQKVITDTGSLLEQERFDSCANLEAARKEIEGINIKGSSSWEEVKISKDIITQLNSDGEEPGPDHKLQKVDAEISKMKYGQIMKDIQLDQVSSSSPYGNSVGSYGLNRIENSETDDQMLELWEAAERDCNNQMQKALPVALEHDMEAVEEEKSEYPSSELVAEKELSIDRLEVPSEIRESHQEQSGKVTERVASDAERLSVLRTSMQELKRKMEDFEKSKRPKILEYDTVKAKLKEAEGAILEMIDTNSKLTKKAEDYPVSSDSMSGAQEETGNMGRRQISKRARRGSEKIGRLELELQKIQYILQKLEEEHENRRTKASDRRPKVLLGDYLYGRRNGPRQKKGRFCGCMRPKTND